MYVTADSASCLSKGLTAVYRNNPALARCPRGCACLLGGVVSARDTRAQCVCPVQLVSAPLTLARPTQSTLRPSATRGQQEVVLLRHPHHLVRPALHLHPRPPLVLPIRPSPGVLHPRIAVWHICIVNTASGVSGAGRLLSTVSRQRTKPQLLQRGRAGRACVRVLPPPALRSSHLFAPPQGNGSIRICCLRIDLVPSSPCRFRVD